MENKEREAAPVSAGVELAYLPTRADMAEALHARSGSPAPWWRLPLIAGLITTAVLVLLLMLAAPKSVTVLVAAALCPALGSLVGGWVNQLYRVRQMTRYARSQGEYTMRADDNGIHAATALVETTIPWASFRHYIETANLFILVIDDTVGGMALLPKRGLRDGADIDGIRAVVARHLAPRPSNG
ncbi:YcxB family protein [Streptomyces sp. NPDC059781]|uniref:YcxB family protein n=1 Tax=Streptomyces sp. NPDC059781 TaxID=3346943 RepID=UPI00364D4860